MKMLLMGLVVDWTCLREKSLSLRTPYQNPPKLKSKDKKKPKEHRHHLKRIPKDGGATTGGAHITMMWSSVM